MRIDFLSPAPRHKYALRTTALVTTFVIAALASAEASARNWPRAGGWDIIEGDGYCALSSEFEGEGDTELDVAKYQDGHVVVAITNDNWSIKDGDKFADLAFRLSGGTYSGGKSLGVSSSGKPGFVTSFHAEFAKDFAKSSFLHVYRGNTVVEKLDLKGSTVALAEVEKCLGHLRAVAAAEARAAAAEAKEKAKFADIPTDPFAAPKTDVAEGVPQPKFDVGTIITGDDYPAVALEAGQEGNVGFRLSVDTEGQVSDCTITQSSGVPQLDQTTCALLRRRARFVPAQKDGQRVVSSYEHQIGWHLVADTPSTTATSAVGLTGEP